MSKELEIKIDGFWERKCSDVVINGKLRISDHGDGRLQMMDISDMKSDMKIFPSASNVFLVECGRNRDEETKDGTK